MDLWYRLVIGKDQSDSRTLYQVAPNILNPIFEVLAKSGYTRGAEIYSNEAPIESNRTYFLNPEAAALFTERELLEACAESCEKPDTRKLKRVLPIPPYVN